MRLIDAERLCESIEKTLRWAEENNHKKIYNCICDIFIPTVVAQPTVEAEPIRHAHFVKSKNFEGVTFCSECRKHLDDTANYCEWCGAKMDEKKDSNGNWIYMSLEEVIDNAD